MALPESPQLTWGAAFANTWVFPGPVDTPRTLSPSIGADAESRSGETDRWEDRQDEMAVLTVRMVPLEDVAGVTGYNGATGVKAALLWLQQQNVGRLYPKPVAAPGTYHEVKLRGYDPEGDVIREQGGARYRVGPLRFRDVNGTAFTAW